MKKYHLFVNGRNFLVADFGPKRKAKGYYQINFKRITKKDKNYQLKKIGFYTNMYVTAKNPKEAELKAVNILRKDKILKDLALNQPNDQPMIFVEEITEIDSFKGCRLPREGLGLYDEKPRKRKKKASNHPSESTR